ncbi:UDP-N-acetylmuramyl-tripeptide synthetase [Denitrovibrio acetiphilus DSM 12809]|uniref:UDP-N-acetylmuramoyl-L-alanyl-D-glutamate--2,6-diaminopimelate ligase n=1 Tax=Denitrovibrio acetiphilus (strain DSM 12809 / NBRC 114555 / N2460) TaxID=522772 RepID=D4H2U5_DENA2|nr:UDP-N-acetylmuramoyl-L-alanyl-D-glutamate--2,6-diaminopimelate ligase [Denitrovibrio acetiphilus]ADD68968.1 UDP-N-acetylmuramyl-tripeptide synthetase [Denitrovibrio acetiphilus DSM 12809]
MKVSQLLDGLSIKGFDLDVDFETDVKDINIDSRNIKRKAPFFAFQGAAVDSHKFAAEVYASGKVPFVVAEHKIEGVPTVVVEDGRKALARACRNFFGKPDEEMDSIAVTGTNGKTTTTYIINEILKTAGRKSVLVGTTGVKYDDKFIYMDSTTPPTYEFFKVLRDAKDAGCDTLVMEVSSHALHQHRINGVVFDVAIFTNLSGDHLDYHKTMDEYFEAKKILFTPEYSRVGVIGKDSEFGERLLKEAEVDRVSYGITNKSEITAEEIWFGLSGLRAKFVYPAGSIEMESSLVGLHNLENLMAAGSGCIMLGIDAKHIKSGIERLKNVPGRLEKFEKSNGAYIFVDFAHTDDALKNVLEALGSFKENRVITVFGCGGDRDRSKRPRMAKTAELDSDVVIVTSDNPRTEDPQQVIEDILVGFENADSVIICPDRSKAIQKAVEMAEPKDIVLIAGKGHEDYMILGTEKIHFDDREEVKKHLEVSEC